ncbi:MAG: SPRY domain-containing protein [Dyella sp.]|uniref:SPRY domain-containing protein n=1 Tax=Dyella sp. TaxID=1869338 RepID=UPI003F821754
MTPLYTIFDATTLGASLELEQSGTVLTINDVVDVNRTARARYPEQVGRWYAELMVYGAGDLLASIGVVTAATSLASYVGGDANGYGYRLDLGEVHNAGASVAAVSAAAKGDIIGVLLDLTTSQPTVTWYRNGQLLRVQDLPSTGPWFLAASLGGTEAYGLRCFLNAGQRAFEFAPPGVDGWYEPPQGVRGLRLASEDWMSDPADVVANTRYDGLLDGSAAELRAVRALDFWPWKRGVKAGALQLSLLDVDGTFDELLASDVRDLPVRIGEIHRGQTYADRVSRYNAVIDSISATDDLTVKITCRDPLALLDVPLQRRLIRPDADTSSANQPVPVVLGACRNVDPVLTNAVDLVYLLSDAPILGIGFARDRGYPLSPTTPDFTLNSTKTAVVLSASPQGQVTVDVSSVGGDQLPILADDILGGAGSPFTGSDGSSPTGFDNVGGDIGTSVPIMNSGVLEFPVVQTQPTIYARVPIYLDAVTGAVALRITWLDAGGAIVQTSDSDQVTGTQAYAFSEVIDTAPSTAVTARVEVVPFNHTAGTVRVGLIEASYVKYGDFTTIGLTNGSFEDPTPLSGWHALNGDDANWSVESGWSADGSTAAVYLGGGVSTLVSDGVVPVTKGDRITLSGRISLNKPDGSNPAGQIGIAWLDGSGNEIAQKALSAIIYKGDRGRYDFVNVTGTAPADCYARVDLGANNDNPPHAGDSNHPGQARPRFDSIAWDYVLEPASGARIPITLDDYTVSVGWQLGAGWSLHPPGANGYLGGAYAEHAPGGVGASAHLASTRQLGVRQAVAYAGWAGITAAKFGAGKTYQVTITIDSMPDDGKSYVGLATGTTIDTMLVSWKKAGTYTVTITNTDGVDHDLYLLAVPFSAGDGTVPVPPTVSSYQVLPYNDTYTPDPISTEPAHLQPIKLADYLREVIDGRASWLGLTWSTADAEAIDTATGYAGIGAYLRGGETVRQAIDLALASYTACLWADADGTLRVARLIAPESVAEGDRAGSIDINALGGDLVPVADTAPGLTTQMGLRRNWAQLSDGDLVSASLNFPLAVRQGMLRQYQAVASTAQPLAGAYRHALYAPPVASTFDASADAQAEIDRVAAIYATQRWFYSVPVELDAVPEMDLGQVWTLTYPKYGLASGKPVMVIDFEPDYLAGTANVIFWG